jgi:hypothetical protein
MSFYKIMTIKTNAYQMYLAANSLKNRSASILYTHRLSALLKTVQFYYNKVKIMIAIDDHLKTL